MRDAFLLGVPTLIIILGILLNRSDVKELRAEMRSEIGELRAEMRSEIGELRVELRSELGGVRADISQLRSEFHHEFREFYRTLGQHDVRIDNLEKRDLT